MDASDENRALLLLNGMLAQWQRKRYLIYALVNQNVVCTGNQTYTVGAGQQFPWTNRPDRVESAYLRILNTTGINPVDYPLKPIYAREEYDRIRLKNLVSISGAIFYDKQWPIGLLYPWPIPQASIYGLFVTFKEALGPFAQLSSPFNYPPEYGDAMMYNLAKRMRQGWGKGMRPDPELNGLARDSLNTLRLANTDVPELGMPPAVQGNKSGYDYHADRMS